MTGAPSPPLQAAAPHKPIDHRCEVCGVFAPFGFDRLPGRKPRWLCAAHKDRASQPAKPEGRLL